MTLLRRELENDGVPVEHWLAVGPFNQAAYFFFVEDQRQAMAANIVAAAIQRHMEGLTFLVEIVEPNARGSAVVAEAGWWEDLDSRFRAIDAAREKCARLLNEAMERAEAESRAMTAQNEKLARRLDALDERLDQLNREANGGDEWKKWE